MLVQVELVLGADVVYDGTAEARADCGAGPATSNIHWERHRLGVLRLSYVQYFIACEEVLQDHSAKHVEQKVFDGQVSHRGFPDCVDCRGSTNQAAVR